MTKVRMFEEDCDPSIATDNTLPSNSFLVEYVMGEQSHFDLVMSNKKVDIFDQYWDKYKDKLVDIVQSEGRRNPKLWNPKK